MHKTTTRFWSCFDTLPLHIQDLARKNFETLKENPHHPSLHFKKVGKLWSARVGSNYRAIAVQDGSDFIWVWIGTHREYEKLI
jgi:mRNA-degrading endonuclease RelE of RelBE toxin-antitoxin system